MGACSSCYSLNYNISLSGKAEKRCYLSVDFSTRQGDILRKCCFWILQIKLNLVFTGVTLYIWVQLVRLIMKTGRVILKVISALLFILMLTFISCAEADICWTCVNPNDITDSFDVCNTMSKNKWESYGYKCD
jgi:hypothetical protein